MQTLVDEAVSGPRVVIDGGLGAGFFYIPGTSYLGRVVGGVEQLKGVVLSPTLSGTAGAFGGRFYFGGGPAPASDSVTIVGPTTGLHILFNFSGASVSGGVSGIEFMPGADPTSRTVIPGPGGGLTGFSIGGGDAFAGIVDGKYHVKMTDIRFRTGLGYSFNVTPRTTLSPFFFVEAGQSTTRQTFSFRVVGPGLLGAYQTNFDISQFGAGIGVMGETRVPLSDDQFRADYRRWEAVFRYGGEFGGFGASGDGRDSLSLGAFPTSEVGLDANKGQLGYAVFAGAALQNLHSGVSIGVKAEYGQKPGAGFVERNGVDPSQLMISTFDYFSVTGGINIRLN